MSRPVRWGFFAALMIFALRLAVGWHFFSAGAEKLQNPGFRASYFLDAAVGPFADSFQGLIPDALGQQRLDLEARRTAWTKFKDKMLRRVGEDEEKSKRGEAVLEEFLAKLDYFESENGPDIEQHLLEVERLAEAKEDPNLVEVEFGKDWLKTKRAELMSATRGWASDLEALDDGFRSAFVTAVEIDPETVDAPASLSGKGWIDHSVTWMTLIVGALLMLGFLTPLASLVGAGFLLSVMLTQPPWVSGANVTYFPYQLVEFVALLFFVVVGAGRCGGLDYFISAFRWRNESSDADLI